MVRIRDASADEAPVLEALQRRSSDIWPEYREQLAANPDAIAVPQTFIDNGWVRVAVDSRDRPVGFSVVIAADRAIFELDGLFVNPAHSTAKTPPAGEQVQPAGQRPRSQHITPSEARDRAPFTRSDPEP
jgi:hypothetical protein